jgi:hypothetical protein
MSSNPSQEYIDPVTVAAFRDVLKTAGLRGVEAEASSDAKREVLLFLNAEFRNGNRTKGALGRRGRDLTFDLQAVGPSKDEALDRWHDEGSR